MEKPVGRRLLGGTGRRKDNIEITQGNEFDISDVDLDRVVNKHKRVDS